tara:strand:- start:2727 stop:3017 length:291 start_codon:yes stop_codon:yes gene_type:complete
MVRVVGHHHHHRLRIGKDHHQQKRIVPRANEAALTTVGTRDVFSPPRAGWGVFDATDKKTTTILKQQHPLMTTTKRCSRIFWNRPDEIQAYRANGT